MSFKFSLQQVMDLYKQKRDQAKKDLDHAENLFEKTATSFYTLLKEKESLESEIDDVRFQKANVTFYTTMTNYLYELEQRIIQKKEDTDAARIEMVQKKEQYREAAKSYKQVERLKERQKQQQIEEDKKTEQQQMDEISMTQYRKVFA